PGGTTGLTPEHEAAAANSEPAEDMVATDIAPAPRGITVPIDAWARERGKPSSDELKPAGYQSNSWRQRTDTGRALTFSSGRLAPASGLDAALTAHTHGLRAEGRQHVYGFVLLRGPVDAGLEKRLAGLDVALLGRHDDHYKARLPITSLRTIAALPEVEWIG